MVQSILERLIILLYLPQQIEIAHFKGLLVHVGLK